MISTATSAPARRVASVLLYSQLSYEPPASAAHAQSRRRRWRPRLPSVYVGADEARYSMYLAAAAYAVISPPSMRAWSHERKPRAAVSHLALMSMGEGQG